MRRTSVCCRPRAEPCGRGQRRGFTLLEILVVMALLALGAALVGPASLRALDAAQARAAGADLQALLEALPLLAFRSGEAQRHDGPSLARRLDLPEAWSVRTEPALEYSAQGAASGGVVTLLDNRGPVLRWRVQPLTGRVADLPPGR